MKALHRIALGCFLLLAGGTDAIAGEVCIYQGKSGSFKSAKGRDQIPRKYRERAICKDEKVLKAAIRARGTRLAAPEDIELSGNIRRERLNSSLGPIDLRWPRTAELLFGRTPLRAMADAARTVSRASRTAAFPSKLQGLNIEWKVVFMDADLPSTQIPAQLRNNCHPGWMTPPANIYIVAQRIAGNCGNDKTIKTTIADAQLTETLVHEIAHALEYHLLEKNPPSFNRMRSEGFATWFETFAAQYSSTLNRRRLQKRDARWALQAIKRSPNSFSFGGSAYDYARASMIFAALEDRFGVAGVMSIYERMNEDRLELLPAIQKEYVWNSSKVAKESKKIAEKLK